MKKHRTNIHESGHAHELTFSCYHSYPFLKAERCCSWLSQAIDESRRVFGYQLWAYVFMPDHVHLIILPHAENQDIASIRRAIKAPVGRQAIEYLVENSPEWLSKVTRQRGKKTERLFWQSGGGYDRTIFVPKTLYSMIDYIHANPVRKNLVEHPNEWKWSSAAWYECHSETPIAVDPIPRDWLE